VPHSGDGAAQSEVQQLLLFHTFSFGAALLGQFAEVSQAPEARNIHALPSSSQEGIKDLGETVVTNAADS
jgi:hypothetical protein